MNEIASPAQLRLAYLRWALVAVPAILFLGMVSVRLANSGFGNRWFAALAMPALVPPGWLFDLVWPIFHGLMALAFAVVLHARGARGRGVAIVLFLLQLALTLAWPPLFFRAHQVGGALVLILVLTLLAAVTTALFWRVRHMAGLLLLPCLGWLAFVAYLNYEVRRLNPDADTLAAPALRTQI